MRNNRTRYENLLRYFNKICISLLCATLVVVEHSKVINGSVLRNSNLQFHNEYYPNVYHQRITRSPGIYIADENGQRVIIIVSKKPVSLKNQSEFTNNYPNQYETNTHLDNLLQKLPGALALIDILTKLGIPGLQSPTDTQEPSSANKESNTRFSAISNQGKGPVRAFNANADNGRTFKKTSLIDILRDICVPGLPRPTPSTDYVGIRFRGGGGIVGADKVGGDSSGPVASGEFGADLGAAIVGGGFSRQKPAADSTNG